MKLPKYSFVLFRRLPFLPCFSDVAAQSGCFLDHEHWRLCLRTRSSAFFQSFAETRDKKRGTRAAVAVRCNQRVARLAVLRIRRILAAHSVNFVEALLRKLRVQRRSFCPTCLLADALLPMLCCQRKKVTPDAVGGYHAKPVLWISYNFRVGSGVQLTF